MQNDPRKLLYDISAACRAIETFCRNRGLADYEADHLLRSACERQFEIIGEAAARLRERHPDVFAQLPEGREIIAFRNRLIYGYDTVDPAIVWDVIGSKLHRLQQVADRFLGSQA